MKSNKTFKALVLSMVSLMICIVLLLGSTLAYFSKSVTSANNVVKIAGFDVEIYYSFDFSEWDELTTTEALFTDNDDALIPGDFTKLVYIKIINKSDKDVKASAVIDGNTQQDSPLYFHYKTVTEAQTDAKTAFAGDNGVAFATASITLLNDTTLAAKASGADEGGSVVIAIALDYPDPEQTAQATITAVTSTFNIIVSGNQIVEVEP